MKRRQQAEQDAERIRNENRQRPNPHRHRPGLLDQIDDGLAWTLEGNAEIAVEDVPDVAAVLDQDRLVESVLRGPRDLRRFRQLAFSRGERVAGNRPRQEKGDERDGEENEDQPEQSPQDVSRHRASRAGSAESSMLSG